MLVEHCTCTDISVDFRIWRIRQLTDSTGVIQIKERGPNLRVRVVMIRVEWSLSRAEVEKRSLEIKSEQQCQFPAKTHLPMFQTIPKTFHSKLFHTILWLFMISCTFAVRRCPYPCHHQVGRPLDITSSSSSYFPPALISHSTKTTSYQINELNASRQCLFYGKYHYLEFLFWIGKVGYL